MRLPSLFLLILAVAGSRAIAAPCEPAQAGEPENLDALRSALGQTNRSKFHEAEKATAMRQLRTSTWNLFARLTTPAPGCGDLPAWRTWTNELQTYANSAEHNSLKLRTTILAHDRYDLKSPSGTFESAYFNPAAYNHIQALKRDYPALSTLKRRDITEFPTRAMVVKAFWHRIRPGQPIRVGLWDWSLANGDTANEDSFPQCVVVTLDNRQPEGLPQCSVLSSALDARSNFYTVGYDEAVKDSFVCKGADCDMKAGDAFILVGLHIAAKELPDWRWATFWWKGVNRHDGDYWTCDNAQRPTTVRQPWDKYSMDTTVSFQYKPKFQPGIYKDDGCELPTLGESPATFNPFVEAASPYGTNSTCIDCHGRARNDPSATKPIPQVGEVGAQLSVFEGWMRTDYLWSAGTFLPKFAPAKTPVE